jgi:hypothetical protein
MKVLCQTEIDAPEGASHFGGNLLDSPLWYKKTEIGVVGEHWWFWDKGSDQWRLSGHSSPHWIKPIESLNVVKFIN